jgi:hypothetical protein
MTSSAPEHQVELACAPGEALAAVGKAAEAWGADWERGIEGGRIGLPIAAGIRRGLARGEIRVERAGGGARVSFRAEETVFYVQTAAVGILVLAAAGGVLTVIWPFFPALLPLAPLGGIVALSGWFLVVSRLTTSTPDDFLRLVSEVAAGDQDDGAAGAAEGEPQAG